MFDLFPQNAQRWATQGYTSAFFANFDGGIYVVRPNSSVTATITTDLHNNEESPAMSDEVCISAGARILKGNTIGDHAIIGANAGGIYESPTESTAVHIPSMLIHTTALPVEL